MEITDLPQYVHTPYLYSFRAALAIAFLFALNHLAVAGGRELPRASLLEIEQEGATVNEDEIVDESARQLHDEVSAEDHARLRRDLNLYSRTVDPSNVQMEERRRVMRKRIQEQFLTSDADGDGSLSRIEATESMPQVARHFSKIDLDGDELITVNELATAFDQMVEKQRIEEAKLLELEQAALKAQQKKELAAKQKSKQAENNRKRAL
jgi:hypothetical protein